MALFKINRGNEVNLPQELHDGYAYFCTDTKKFYIDHQDAGGQLMRSPLSAEAADKLIGSIDGTEVEISVEDINNKINALKSTTENITLSASTWANGIYTYLNTNITETNIIELYPTIDITTEQLEALQSANIISGTQEAGSIQLVAKGDVPTIDIPVKIVVRGDL